jgi:multidrug efflux system membrane fusion protein
MKLETPAAGLETMYSGQGEGSTIRTGITGVRWWVWVAGALLLAMIGYWLLVRNSAARSASQASSAMGHQAVPVTVAPATQGEFSRYITALGSVTPYYTVTVKTRVDGQLDTVNFKEGQMVAEGELLAQVDPRPFQAALEQAQGQLAKDKASLAYARVTIERDQVLFNHNVISRDALDSQTSTLGQYEGAIETDQANIDTARLNLIYSHITSPLSGRIGLRLVDPGNIIHATDTTGIAVITQLQPIAVLFNIPEDDLPKVLSTLKTGRTMTVQAYDRDMKNRLADGSLLTLDNQIDPTTGTIRLKASFPNTDNALFPNQFVNVKLLVDTDPKAVIVQASAIQRSPQGAFVFVVKPDQTVAVRDITVGAIQGETASIRSGLQPGETVVTDGVDKLQAGSKVRVQAQPATAQASVVTQGNQ